MTIKPRLLRRAAALLASFALLAIPARGVLACEMGSASTPVSGGGGHDHAALSHHDSSVTPAPSPAEAPTEQHPQCDHLVGCAPLALTRSAVLLPDVTSATALDVPFVADGAESPARSLEPPPPKR